MVRTSHELKCGCGRRKSGFRSVCLSLGLFFLLYKGKKAGRWEDGEEKSTVRIRWIGGTCGVNEAAYVEAMFPK
jgi:hypothetical protein